MLNKKLFKSEMCLNSDTNASLASYIGITPQRFSAKLNARKGAEFTQSEIEKIKYKWNLTPEKTDAIFFKKQVS